MWKAKWPWPLLFTLLITGFLLVPGCGNGPDQSNTDEAAPGPNNGNTASAGCWDYQPGSMQPNAGWDDVDLEGLTREELVEVLGCPPHVIRMTSVVSSEHNRELWVYHPYDEDPTGLFVWLKGNVFHDSTLDEFNGFWCYEMSDLDFWE